MVTNHVLAGDMNTVIFVLLPATWDMNAEEAQPESVRLMPNGLGVQRLVKVCKIDFYMRE